jgi:GxxExxY protein
VEDKAVIEIKSVESLTDIHFTQILTCLKLSESKVGLLISINVVKLIDGLKRVVNKF